MPLTSYAPCGALVQHTATSPGGRCAREASASVWRLVVAAGVRCVLEIAAFAVPRRITELRAGLKTAFRVENCPDLRMRIRPFPTELEGREVAWPGGLRPCVRDRPKGAIAAIAAMGDLNRVCG